MLSAEVEHFLGLGNAADRRAGETAAAHDEVEGGKGERFLGRADKSEIAIATKESEISVDIVIGGHGIEDEIEAAGVLLHLIVIARDDDFVGAKAEGIL